MKGIEITDASEGFLTVELRQILDLLSSEVATFSWSIWEIEAVGDLGPERDMLTLESEVRDAPAGLKIAWPELLRIANSIDDIINATIEGLLIDDRAPGSSTEANAVKERILIQMIDSSVWVVCSTRDEILTKLEITYEQTERIDDC
jgi:hypothetical protein